MEDDKGTDYRLILAKAIFLVISIPILIVFMIYGLYLGFHFLYTVMTDNLEEKQDGKSNADSENQSTT